MPVVHIVLVKARPNASTEAVDALLKALNNMKTQLPDLLLYLSAGTNFTERSQGYTHALVVKVASKEALQQYLEHPVHVQLVEQHLKPLMAAPPLVVDYEM
ncbi:hypothetical protein RI367_008009 [Sorochytrium milnesiophthora]